MYGLMMWEAHMHSFFFSVCQVLLKMGGLKKICNLCYLCQEIYFLWLLRLYISFQSLSSNQNYVLEDTFNLPCQQQRNHPSKKLEFLTHNFFATLFQAIFKCWVRAGWVVLNRRSLLEKWDWPTNWPVGIQNFVGDELPVAGKDI